MAETNKPRVPRVLIVVEGGCVQSVLADAPVDYQVKDWDNIKEGDGADFLEDGFDGADLMTPEKLDEERREGVDDEIAAQAEAMRAVETERPETEDV